MHGWHIDAVADHLTAVTRSQINRLLINEPPGTMKSVETSVVWPAHEWGPANLATMRYLGTSYADAYATRDSRRMRDLVLSEWYQARWPVQLTRFGESSFENTEKGWREAVAFKSLTGGRAHRVIIDDPHSTEGAESDADRSTAERIFKESVTTRLVEPATSAIIVIMQRLNVKDISAIAIEHGYTYLMLPMEFERDRKCFTYFKDGTLLFEDPRTKEGELLFPERFPREVVDRDKAVMGSFATAGQFQQRPTLREGGLFKRHWWVRVKAAEVGTRWVRAWDLAATAEQMSAEAAWTAGIKFGRQPSGRYIVGDVKRERAEGQGVRRLIKETAIADGRNVEIDIPKDPGQAGKVQSQDMVRMLEGYIVHVRTESGDKITRAEPVAAQVEAGNVDILINPDGTDPAWVDALISEGADFPGSKFKDQIDALSGAFARLIGTCVFSIPEAAITEPDVVVPSIWTRVAVLDVYEGLISCVWMAFDRNSGTAHVYDTYVQAFAAWPIHAKSIRDRGHWIPLLFDPRGPKPKRSEENGEMIAMAFADLNLNINTIELDEEMGIQVMAERLYAGRMRVFRSKTEWFAEYRRYLRDEKGETTKKDVGLIRATQLALLSGPDIAISEARYESDKQGYDRTELERSHSATGY